MTPQPKKRTIAIHILSSILRRKVKQMRRFNVFSLNIQFTYESSKKSIAYLDLDVAMCNGKLESTANIEPLIDINLRYSPSYLEHTKRSIVFSQTLRVSRISSRDSDLRDHCLQTRSWFLKRKYLKNSLIMK